MKFTLWPLAVVGLLIGFLLISMLLMPPSVSSSVISNIAISSTGRWLAAGTHDGHISICDRKASLSCRTIDTKSEELNDLRFSPDERFLAVANSNLELVALDSRTKSFFLRTDKRNYGTVRFDNSGTELVTVNSRSEIELIDIESGATLNKFCCSSFYGEVAFVASDTQIVNAGHWPRIWDRRGKPVRSLTANRQDATFRPIAIDEKEEAIFMGSQDGRVYVWSLDSFTLLKRSPAQADYVDTIAIIPKIQSVAYCSFGKPLRLWSIAGGGVSAISNLRPSSNLVALSDDKSILFGTDSGTVETWDLEGYPHHIFTLPLFPRH